MTTTAHERLIPAARLKRGPFAREDERREAIDIRGLWKELRDTIEGEVRFDPGSIALYAQDASNYYQPPIGVVLPKNADDVVAAVAACRRFGAAIVARTGGTALAGQTCGAGIILDFSKYMNAIVALDPQKRIARVEPGVVCDELSHAAKPFDLTWGPQPATHSRCGFGGMIANNCGGMHAQYAGIAVHNVEALDVVLYDGTRMHLSWMTDESLREATRRNGREGLIYKAISDLRDRYASRIRADYPKLARRVSGYNLDELLPKEDGRFNVARALVGTEGTCAITLEATIRLVDLRPKRVVVLLGFPTIFAAADAIPAVLAAEPDAMAIEGMDQRLYDHTKKKAAPGSQYLKLLPKGHGWLFVQIGSDDLEASKARGRRLIEAMRASVVDAALLDSKEEQEHLWAMREDGLGTTAFVPGEADTWEGWEDSAVPPEHLGNYLRDLDALYKKYGYESVLYGHFGQGLVHCRVDFELTRKEGIAHFHAFLAEAADLVAKKYGGSLSGEHGDGQSKAEFLEKMYGPELVRAFAEFKAIWDPDSKMNPGKIVRPFRADENLRLGASYDPSAPKTHFQFPSDDGSFARATMRCVGIGKCRNKKSERGAVMCPSFMVTGEERHSTRGRAHLMFEMLRGTGPIEHGFRDDAVKESLDLCLACKGCKGDCPTNVDVATHKAEFLSHYYEGRLRPRHAYAFGLIDRWSRLASHLPLLANLTTQLPVLRSIAKWVAGVHPKRSIPKFAPETFLRWFRRRARERSFESPNKVLLWPDTFTNHFHPEIAQAAVRVLERLHFQVIVPAKPICCGRPLYDFGMLDRAKEYLEDALMVLKPHVDAGIPMVVLEPSCASVFRDELTDLFPTRNEAKNLKAQTFTLSELLLKYVGRDELSKIVPPRHRKAIVQTHCHHHAVMRFDADVEVFKAMGIDTEVLDSGCCGMAGSFGFAKESYDVSSACGERVLLPRVRAEHVDTLVLADGFSCKTQIAQGAARHALHLAEVLDTALGEDANQLENKPNALRTRTPSSAALLVCFMALALVGAAFALCSIAM